MPTGLLTRSQYTTNPPSQLSAGDDLEVRGFYTRSFIAGDGVTPVTGNSSNGAQGPYYSIGASLNADGDLVVAAQEIQATTLSNPTANYIEQLWVNGAFVATLLPNTQGVSGWQIPTVYGDPIAYDEIATYNRAKRLLYAPDTYFTADQVIQEIRRLAGNFDYMAVGVNGIGQASFPPVVASAPQVLMANDPRVGDWFNIESYFADTGSTAAQNAVAIAAAVTAAASAGGGIYIPLGTFVTNSVTISVPIMFAPGSSILSPATGQTVTITKSITADVSKHFANATAGLGTISLSGNTAVTEAWAAWWGASSSATAAVNGAALNAANAALVTNSQGTINVGPGLHDFNVALFLGSDSASFTSINLEGVGGSVGTILRWTGSTSARAISITKGRFNRISKIGITNGVAAGTTVGLYIGGPSGFGGTATHAVDIQDVQISGFHVGEQLGDVSGTTAASEIVHINVDYISNDIGLLQTSTGNSLSPWFYGCGSSGNTQRGFDFETGGAGHFYGGDMGHQPITFWVGAGGTTLHVDGVRFELDEDDQIQAGTAANVGGCFIYVAIEIAGATTTANYLFDDGAGNGAFGNFSFIGCAFSDDGITKIIIPVGVGSSLYFSGNLITDQATGIFATNNNSAGATYTLQNNVKVSAGLPTGHWDEERGIVVASGVRVPVSQITWNGSTGYNNALAGYAGGTVSPAQISSNQNNYAPTANCPRYLRLNSDTSRNVTGLTFTTAQIAGQTTTLINVGTQNIVLVNQSGLSTDVNRFLNSSGADITLAANQAADLEYDATTQRWRVFKRT